MPDIPEDVIVTGTHSFFLVIVAASENRLGKKLFAREYRKLEQGFIHEQIQKLILRQTYAVLWFAGLITWQLLIGVPVYWRGK